MNRSDLALASFVDRYECDPTFRPVILVVMCQNLINGILISAALIAAAIGGCEKPSETVQARESQTEFAAASLETSSDVQRALLNARSCKRAIVFLHLDWAPMAPQRDLYIRFMDEYHHRFPLDDVRFHYVDCTPITDDYAPLTSLPGWPGTGRDIYANGTGGWGDVVWINDGIVRHVETITDSKTADEFAAKTRNFFGLNGGGT